MRAYSILLLVFACWVSHSATSKILTVESINVHSCASFDTILVQIGEFEILYSEELMQPLQATYTVTCPDPFVGECESSIGWRVSRAEELAGYEVITSKPKHYKNNDWDRGHLIPVASVDCDCESKAVTYTYLNCALQHSGLNRGPWKQLEEQERDIAKSTSDEVKVIVDVLFKPQAVPMCYDCPTIPSAFRKTIINEGDTLIFEFPNLDPGPAVFSQFRIR